MSSRAGSEARAAERRSWPGQLLGLEEQGSEDLSASTTRRERIAMMWRLAVDAWAMAGREIPNYGRAEMPGRLIRAPAEDRS
jgi:hypothetical protein